jgi:curved DNA-binding protein
MENLYEILGVSESANTDQIKTAYRKLAAKHHPDKGGDTATFQKISVAYETLTDPQKRSQYDQMRSNPNQFRFDSQNWQGFEDFFGRGNPFAGSPFEHFFNQARGPHRRRNRDLSIRVIISLKQSYTGCDLEANYQLPSGKNQKVVIKVPPGIQSGQIIRYHGMGDDSVNGIPPGDLNVTVIVENSQEFERRNDDLIVYCSINPIEAMIGSTKAVDHIDGTKIKINIVPGTQHGTEIVVSKSGFKNLSGNIGNLIVCVIVKIPKITEPNIKSELEKIYAKISKTS